MIRPLAANLFEKPNLLRIDFNGRPLCIRNTRRRYYRKGGDRACHSITAIIDMRLPHGVKIPADATGIIRTCCSRIGLTLYHAESLHVNDKPLRGGYVVESIRETGLSSRDHWGDGKSLYCKPSHLRTASISAAPQPQISRVSSCSRSSSGSRCLRARRAFLHMPV